MSSTRVFRNEEGDVIGTLTNGVYEKTVKKSIHHFRLLDAWGIEESVVNELRSLKCTGIHIYEKEDDRHYVIDFKVFDKNGIRRDYSTPQVFLPVSWFGNQLALPDGQQKKRKTTKKDSIAAQA